MIGERHFMSDLRIRGLTKQWQGKPPTTAVDDLDLDVASGEFLVLLGAYRASAALTAVATLGLIAAVVYALILVQKTFHGENTHVWRLPDSSIRETATLGALVAVSVWLGLYPQPVLDAATSAVSSLQTLTSSQLKASAK